jgi:hypothetical protein
MLDRPPLEKLFRRVLAKTSVPDTFEVVAPTILSHSTFPLVGTHYRQECLMQSARVFVKTYHPGFVNHKNKVRAVLYGSVNAGNNWQPTGI